MPLNHTSDTYSIFSQYPQITTNQQSRTDSSPVFSSLRTMDTERRDCASALHSFKKNYSQDGRVKESVATVEEFSDFWKPGAMDGVPPFVMNCNCIQV